MFDPWAGKIPWRREWQPSPVFLPGKSHGQRILAGGPRVYGVTESPTGLSTNTFAFCCQRCDSPETTSLTLASVSSSVSSGAQSLKRWAHSAFGPATADKCTVPSWTADVTGTDTGIERGSYQLPTSAVGKQARNGPGLPSSKLEQL